MATGKPIGSFYVQLGLNTKDFQRNLKGAERDLKQAFGASAIRTSELLAASVAVVGASLLAVGAAAVSMAADLERSTVSFTRLLGSADAADKKLRSLQEFASKTPYTFTELINYEKRLLALGFQADKTREVLTTVGDTASGLGLDNEGMGRLIKAFGDIKTKAVLSTQEMKQFAEVGVGAYQILAKEILGSADKVAELDEMIQNRAISSEQAISAMFRGLNQQFGGMMELQSQTISGMWSTVRDEGENVLRIIGKQIIESSDLKAALDTVRGAATEFRITLQDSGFQAAFSNLLGDNAIFGIKVLAGTITGALIPAIIAMGTAITAAVAPLIPLMAVGAGATALVVGITSLVDKSIASKDPFAGKSVDQLDKMLTEQKAKYSEASAKLSQLTDPSQSFRRAESADIATAITNAQVQYQGELDYMNRITEAISAEKTKQTATMGAIENVIKDAAAAVKGNSLYGLFNQLTTKEIKPSAGMPATPKTGGRTKTDTSKSDAERALEDVKRNSEQIQQAWLQQTGTREALLDAEFQKEFDTLEKSKAINKNYHTDLALLSETYSSKGRALMEVDAAEKLNFLQQAQQADIAALEERDNLYYESFLKKQENAELEATLNADQRAGDLAAYIEHLDAKALAERASLEGRRQMIDVYDQLQADATRSQASYMAEAYRTIYSGLTESLTGIITGAKNAGDAFKELGMQIIQMIVKWTIQRKLAAIMAGTIEATTTAASVVMAGTVAAAWAPAAAMVAAATFGASTAAAAAGLTGLSALSKGLSLPMLADGGIVSKPTVLMAGEGGESEAIIPLSKLPGLTGGGGGVTLNVINQTGQPVNARSSQRMDGARTVVDLFLEGYSRNVSGIQDVVGGR